MAKAFDFSAFNQPTMEVTLKGEEPVVLHVTTPSEYMIEQLLAAGDDIAALKCAKNIEAVRWAFDFGAKLLSCNTAGLQVTAEDLRDKYHVGTIALVSFFAAYMDFISEITNAKN